MKTLLLKTSLITLVISFSLIAKSQTYTADEVNIKANGKLRFGYDDPTTGQMQIHNATCCYNTFVDCIGNLYFRTEASQATLGIQKDATVTIGVWPKYNNSVTDTDGNKLMVNGGILCESITVNQDVPGSDYVFEKSYNLRSLKEVETFVKKNKHLPEVPSAQEFKENGYKLGEMDNLLLKKVEELTLYLIEQEKRIEALEAENTRLKNRSN